MEANFTTEALWAGPDRPPQHSSAERADDFSCSSDRKSSGSETSRARISCSSRGNKTSDFLLFQVLRDVLVYYKIKAVFLYVTDQTRTEPKQGLGV